MLQQQFLSCYITWDTYHFRTNFLFNPLNFGTNHYRSCRRCFRAAAPAIRRRSFKIYPYSFSCLAFLRIGRISVTNHGHNSQNCDRHGSKCCFSKMTQNYSFLYKLRQKRCCRTPACYFQKTDNFIRHSYKITLHFNT